MIEKWRQETRGNDRLQAFFGIPKCTLDLRVSLNFNFKTLVKLNLQQDVLAEVARRLSTLNFGELTIVVHDGKVAYVEVKEKIRVGQG